MTRTAAERANLDRVLAMYRAEVPAEPVNPRSMF